MINYQSEGDKVNMKCFDYQKQNCTGCTQNKCRYWIKSSKNGNCVIAAACEGPQTLQDIGEMFSVTRMRICQIEKSVIKKIRKKITNYL
jgi:hypothetical protein